MSTRYVWNLCEIQYPEPTLAKDEFSGISFSSSFGPNHTRLSAIACSKYRATLKQGDNSNQNPSVIYQVAEGAPSIEMSGTEFIDSSQYPYVIFINSGLQSRIAKAGDYSSSGNWFIEETSSSSSSTCYLRWTKSSMSAHQYYYSGGIPLSSISKGNSIGKRSNASSYAYPQNSYKKPNANQTLSEWYEYLGSDSIDPTSVTYSASGSKPGDKITVSVTPGSNKYGGTISYLYQYSTNGGSTWSTIETTTATSISFTIPANANTIQFRARAQDDMGFVSSTYVTSASATVERLNAWVGVSGKARKGVELYVGVNGKARKVTGAWIGVNGKARRFL